jgi:transcriptional regulator with XRE-family HTH domain
MHPNKGAKLLSERLRQLKLSQKEAADRIGVAQPTVCHWLDGSRKPTFRPRVDLEVTFAVPAESWDEPALEEQSPPDAAA